MLGHTIHRLSQCFVRYVLQRFNHPLDYQPPWHWFHIRSIRLFVLSVCEPIIVKLFNPHFKRLIPHNIWCLNVFCASSLYDHGFNFWFCQRFLDIISKMGFIRIPRELTKNFVISTQRQFFIHPPVCRVSHWTLSMKFVVKGLLFRLAPLNTMKGFNLVVPSTFPVRQAETRILSCPVDFMWTSFEPFFSTVVLETISIQTDVSPIAIMSASWKLNCFSIQRTYITYATMQSNIYDGSLWAVVVFLLRENPCLYINFSHHPRLATNESLIARLSIFR